MSFSFNESSYYIAIDENAAIIIFYYQISCLMGLLVSVRLPAIWFPTLSMAQRPSVPRVTLIFTSINIFLQYVTFSVLKRKNSLVFPQNLKLTILVLFVIYLPIYLSLNKRFPFNTNKEKENIEPKMEFPIHSLHCKKVKSFSLCNTRFDDQQSKNRLQIHIYLKQR